MVQGSKWQNAGKKESAFAKSLINNCYKVCVQDYIEASNRINCIRINRPCNGTAQQFAYLPSTADIALIAFCSVGVSVRVATDRAKLSIFVYTTQAVFSKTRIRQILRRQLAASCSKGCPLPFLFAGSRIPLLARFQSNLSSLSSKRRGDRQDCAWLLSPASRTPKHVAATLSFGAGFAL